MWDLNVSASAWETYKSRLFKVGYMFVKITHFLSKVTVQGKNLSFENHQNLPINRLLHFLLAKHLEVFNECGEFSSPSEIALFPSPYFSRSGQPNHWQNVKDHLSMAKVETALVAEFSVCDLAELFWCSMTKSQAGEDLRSGPGPGILLGQQSTQGTKSKEALTLRCLPCMCSAP